MSIEIEAVYENGSLKLDQPLPLEEHQRVRVTVQTESRVTNLTASENADWWKALQGVWADQEKRGFVGTITEVDRSDDGYDQRMRDILRNSVHGSEDG